METGRAAPIDLTLLLHRGRAGAIGAGLFSVHAALYLLVAFALFVWNLIDHPANLGVPAPRLIIPWGVVVLIHAAVVAVFSVLHEVWEPEAAPAPVAPRVEAASAAVPAPESQATTSPPKNASRFRPATTSLADVRDAGEAEGQGSWRRPVQSIRHAAASWRQDGNHGTESSGPWDGDGRRLLTDEEQRAVGSQQLAQWRGGRAPAGNGQGDGPGSGDATARRPPKNGQSAVVRPITPSADEFDETEWRWLEAAATSHLARRDSTEPEPSPPDGSDGASSSS